MYCFMMSYFKILKFSDQNSNDEINIKYKFNETVRRLIIIVVAAVD